MSWMTLLAACSAGALNDEECEELKALLKKGNEAMSHLRLLKKALRREIDDARCALRDFVFARNDDYKVVVEAEFKELPRFLGRNKRVDELVARRLSGEDIDTPAEWIEIISDCEFSYDHERYLSENDGYLWAASRLCRVIGEEDMAEEALKYTYHGD